MPLKAAIVGAGRRSAAHLASLQEIGPREIAIAGIADTDLSRAESACARHGGRPYTNASEMLDKESPDVLYVILPYHLHGAVLPPLIERRIPMFVEKALAHNLADATALAAAFDRVGTMAAFGYQWRDLECIDKAREILGSRPIGMIAARYYSHAPAIPWIREARHSGGQALAQMTHLFDLARVFAGDPATVYAQRTARTHPSLAEVGNADNWSVTIRFENEILGDFLSTYSLFNYQHGDPAELALIAEGVHIAIERGRMTVTEARRRETFIYAEKPELRMHRHFLEAVRTGDASKLRCNAREALQSALVSFAAIESADKGVAVRPGDLLK